MWRAQLTAPAREWTEGGIFQGGTGRVFPNGLMAHIVNGGCIQNTARGEQK